jgi:hypothetical protein
LIGLSLLVAFSVGADLVICGLQAAYAPEGSKHDFPVAPYFVFGSVALLCRWGCSSARARGSLRDGAHCPPSLAGIFRFFDCRFFLFSRPAKSNAKLYTRIKTAFRAAARDNYIVDLLAESRVVHEDVQTQVYRFQTGPCPVITSVVFASLSTA